MISVVRCELKASDQLSTFVGLRPLCCFDQLLEVVNKQANIIMDQPFTLIKYEAFLGDKHHLLIISFDYVCSLVFVPASPLILGD